MTRPAVRTGVVTSKVIGSDKQLMGHVELLMALFERADRAALQGALERGDMSAACDALEINQNTLRVIIDQGQEFARLFAEEHPVAAEILRRASASGHA